MKKFKPLLTASALVLCTAAAAQKQDHAHEVWVRQCSERAEWKLWVNGKVALDSEDPFMRTMATVLDSDTTLLYINRHDGTPTSDGKWIACVFVFVDGRWAQTVSCSEATAVKVNLYGEGSDDIKK